MNGSPLTESMAGGSESEPVGIELHFEVAQFLYREAELLDERRFSEWLTLFDADVHYWMPVRTNRMPREIGQEFEGPQGAAYFDDDFEHLQLRVAKIATERSWSETPPSRTRHLVTNVRVRTNAAAEEYEVSSNFLVYRSRSSRMEDLFAGQRNDLLRRGSDGDLKIARRHILIDQAVLLSNSLSVFF